MLLRTERAKGGQPYQKKSTTNIGGGVENLSTLAEIGLTKRESSEAQFLDKKYLPKTLGLVYNAGGR